MGQYNNYASSAKSKRRPKDRLCWKCSAIIKSAVEFFCPSCNIIQRPSTTATYFELLNRWKRLFADLWVISVAPPPPHLLLRGCGRVTSRQNALRMSRNLSFRSITHFRFRIKIQCKQAKIPYCEVWKLKVRVWKRKWVKGLSHWKVYSSFKFQALAPKGLVFALTTKNERISGAYVLDKSIFSL